MVALFEKKNLPFVFLFVIVFISRLPFLSAGYGVEEDSWGIALEAYNTNRTGIYEPSRLPGHPFQEFIYSALWGSGPIVFNGLCAFFSALGALFFALILKQLKFNSYFLAAFAFAFTPVYYISSTYTIDFAWSQALIMIAFYFVLKKQYILSGVFLGLAIGCRITCGVMLIPFMLIIWQDDFKLNIMRFFKMSISMGIVAIVLFIPIIQKYGLSFFMYYDQFPYPPFTKVMYKMIVGVFGLIGTVSLGIFLLQAVFNKKNQRKGEGFNCSLDKKVIIASIVIIVLYAISYFRLPQKSGYMIPVIPFVILLFGYYLHRKNFNWFCWSLIISSFLFGINLTDAYRGADHSRQAIVFTISGQEIYIDPFTGPVFSDYSKRKQKIAFTDLVIGRADTITAKTVIIAGWWYNEIMVTMIPKESNKFVKFESYIDAEKINSYCKEHYQLYYLPEQNLYNDLKYNMKVTDELSKPFIKEK
jgi:hypothetical protein